MRKKYYIYRMKKILLLVLIINKSFAQCDSAVEVCPVVIDYLFKQNILAQKYYSDNLNLLSQKSQYEKVIVIKDSVISEEKKITALTVDELVIEQSIRAKRERELDNANKTIQRQKIVQIIIAGVGLITTTYFIIH